MFTTKIPRSIREVEKNVFFLVEIFTSTFFTRILRKLFDTRRVPHIYIHFLVSQIQVHANCERLSAVQFSRRVQKAAECLCGELLILKRLKHAPGQVREHRRRIPNSFYVNYTLLYIFFFFCGKWDVLAPI